MSKYLITAYPYAIQEGYIEVPDDIDNPEEYIRMNWEKVKFCKPSIDYKCADFDYEVAPEENCFTITCGGETKIYPESERDEQIKFYKECMLLCNGCERERYTNIYLSLIEGDNDCRDEL